MASGLTLTYPTAGTYELKVKTSTGWQNQPVLWTREATEMDDADFFYAKGSIWEKNAIKLPADPPPPPPPPPDEHADGTVYTVDTMSTDAIQTALNNCNAYDVVQLKAGIYQRGTNNALNIPDYVRLRGTGIYKQSVPGGGGGTWIQAGLRWGSYVRCGTNSSGVGDVTKGFLAGYNAVGRGAYHFGQQKNTTVSGNYAYTKTHGCTGSRFCFVRFKGGTDGPLKTVQLKLAGGAPGPTVQYRDVGGELFGNGSTYRRYWASDSLGDYFLIDNIFEDCEFERPQGSTLSSQPFPLASGCAYVKTWEDGHTTLEPHGNWPYGNPGSLHNLWVDCRVGGNKVRGNHWLRCH